MAITIREREFIDYMVEHPEETLDSCYFYVYKSELTRPARLDRAMKLLRKLDVIAYLHDVTKQRLGIHDVDADYVMHRLFEMDQLDPADILDDRGLVKHIRHWPRTWRLSINAFEVSELMAANSPEATLSIMKKIRWPQKEKILELLGKHYKVQAFRDRSDTTIVNMSHEEWLRTLSDQK